MLAPIRLFAGSTLLCLLTPFDSSATESTALFDGHSRTGRLGDSALWKVEDQTITAEIPAGARLANNAFLFSEAEFGDFELSLEFQISGAPSANSGIQFRTQRDDDGHARGYQADLDGGDTWLGRIYDEQGRALLVEPGTRVSIAPDGRRWVDTFAELSSFSDLYRPDEWNTYQISARASHVEIRINGRLCSVLDDHQIGEADLSGHIALQLHSGPGPAKVQFRNLQLVDLGRTAPAPVVEDSRTTRLPASTSATTEDGRHLNLDFEANDLSDWTPIGDAWENQPNRVPAPRPRSMPVRPVKLGCTKARCGGTCGTIQPVICRSQRRSPEGGARHEAPTRVFRRAHRGRSRRSSTHRIRHRGYGWPKPIPTPSNGPKVRAGTASRSLRIRTMTAVSIYVKFSPRVSIYSAAWVSVSVASGLAPRQSCCSSPTGTGMIVPAAPPEELLDGWGFQDTHETLDTPPRPTTRSPTC